LRYAHDTGQELINFYSADRPYIKHSPSRDTVQNRSLTEQQQKSLWILYPDMTEHHPGRLPLCVGMPVMIKRNQATECRITNGAEGVIAGWEQGAGAFGQPKLNALFVRLAQPSSETSFEGLPPDVVPVAPQELKISCKLPDDREYDILRTQIPVVLNFAMTDFAAQGRTREHNVVHIESCNTPNSYYVCLSRSSSAKNTIIIGDIEPKYISNGLSSQLRQEFRVLEILDEISRMKYDGEFPLELEFENRSDAISAYGKHFQDSAPCPNQVHPSLSWSQTDPLEKCQEWKVKWKVVGGKDELAKTKTKKGMADETASIVDSSCGNVKSWNAQPPQHCNQQDEDIFKMDVVTISTATEQLKCADLPVPMEVDEPTQQMTFMNNLQSIGPRLSVSKTMPGSFPDVIGDNGPTTLSSISLNQPPQGLKWSNNSCAYDALLTVLYRSFTSDLRSWDKYKDPTTHIVRAIT
jgi:hypothetical protein